MLVLGVGGTLGEAWLRGVLSGLEAASGLDFRRCEYFVGSSAGSIVAATLAAGRRPEAGDRAAREWGEAAPEPAGAPGLLGRAARAAGAGRDRRREPAGAGGAGRCRARGPRGPRRGAQRAPARRPQPVGPRPPRRVAGRALRRPAADLRRRPPQRPAGDVRRARRAARRRRTRPCSPPARFPGCSRRCGSAAASTSTAASGARRTSTRRRPAAAPRVLCLVPTAALGAARSPAGALRAFTSTAVAAETLALRSRGAQVRTITPDAASARGDGRQPDGPAPPRGGPRRGVRPGPRYGVGVSSGRGPLLLGGLRRGHHPPLGVRERADVGLARPPR